MRSSEQGPLLFKTGSIQHTLHQRHYRNYEYLWHFPKWIWRPLVLCLFFRFFRMYVFEKEYMALPEQEYSSASPSPCTVVQGRAAWKIGRMPFWSLGLAHKVHRTRWNPSIGSWSMTRLWDNMVIVLMMLIWEVSVLCSCYIVTFL